MNSQENLLYEDDGENEEYSYKSDHDYDLDGNENHDDDVYHLKFMEKKFTMQIGFYCFCHGISQCFY